MLTSLIHNGYREERMGHFLRVIGSALDGYVKAYLGRVNLWDDPYRKVARALRECQARLNDHAAIRNYHAAIRN